MVLQLPVLIHTKHGRNNPDLRKDVFFNRVASLLSDAIVAVSADAALVATSVERVPWRKVRVIHNGIELARFPYHDRSNRTQPISAIHVARLNVIKDQKTLLAAVRLVVNEVSDFRLNVVGDGPMRQELLDFRDQLGLAGSVEFLGERDDVPELLARADLFVLSSLQEGLSLTLLEAMASGLPVVATDVGGNRELVSPWKTGLLVPKQSPERLAAAILELVKRREVLPEISRQGRVLVERQFSIEGMVRQYEDLYVRLVQQKVRHLN